MNCEAIGYVKSPVKEPREGGWGEIVSEIVLEERYAPGLKGLTSFSHIMVIFYMHQSTWEATADLVRRPRGRADMPEIGIFAQRAKHRPNPIGITAVRLLGVAGNRVRVQGLDAIEGTPVLDMKPYFPEFDSPAGVQVPEWVHRLMAGYF